MIATDPLFPESYRVAERRHETADTVTLHLEPTNGDRPLAFAPGQFNMLYAFGNGEVPVSFSGDPTRHELAHTIRAVGAVSEALTRVEPGEIIGLRGPFGTTWPADIAHDRDALIIAGGIGLAPLRPLIHQLLHQRDRFRSVTLLYGGRSPDELLFRDQLEQWRDDPAIDVHLTVDTADRRWRGHVGVVTALFAKAGIDPPHTTAYICGPEVMMRFAARDLGSMGVPQARTYVSLERNMHCAIGHCGHCQLATHLVCLDGPVFAYPRVGALMRVKEL